MLRRRFARTGTRTPTPPHAVDVWFLNLFPREQPFRFNAGGYQTLNFVPSLATMIFGLMAGEMLRERPNGAAKFPLLVAAALACLAVGLRAWATTSARS